MLEPDVPANHKLTTTRTINPLQPAPLDQVVPIPVLGMWHQGVDRKSRRHGENTQCVCSTCKNVKPAMLPLALIITIHYQPGLRHMSAHTSVQECVYACGAISLSLSLSLSLLPKTSPAPEDFALSRSQVDHLVCNAHVGWLSGWLASSWLAAYLYPAYPANNTNQQSQPTNLPTKPQPTEIEMGICPGCILPRFVYGKGLENVISPHLWPCTRFNLSRENAHETAMSEKA